MTRADTSLSRLVARLLLVGKNSRSLLRDVPLVLARPLGALRTGLEATYAQMIHLGEEIIAGSNEHFRVVDVVPFEEEDESPFVGLQVEAA